MARFQRSAIRVLTNAFWDIYDNLGQAMLVNLAWLVLSLGIVTAPLGAAGIFFWSERLVGTGEARWRDFFVGVKRAALRFVFMFCVAALFAAMWVLALLFYLRVFPGVRPVGPLLGGITVWIGVAFVLAQAVTLPLVARPTIRLTGAIKQGWIVMLSGPFLCVFAAVELLMVQAVLLFLGAGVLVLSGAFGAVFCSYLLRELSGVKEPAVLKREARKHSWRGTLRPWE